MPGSSAPPCGDLLILVVSCRLHGELREAIRNTWAPAMKARGVHYLFVVGDEGRGTGVEGDVLFVETKDSYEYLVLKVLLAFEYVHRNLAGRFRYVFKVDDDCYVNADRLLRLPFRQSVYSGRVLQVHKVKPDATWHVGKCEDKSFEQPYTKPYKCNMATGIGYFIRTDVLGVLVEEIPTVRQELGCKIFDFEDKRVAETLHAYGVPATPLEGYAAVFLAKDSRTYAKEWRVHVRDTHRFICYDVITECNASDIHMIHEEVAPYRDPNAASASPV